MSENKDKGVRLARDSEKLKKASFGAIFGVLFSRASGVLRTSLVNAYFGVGLSLDAFNAAFRFPNSLRDLFADGALSASFIKVLVEEKEKGKAAEKKLISIVIGFFSFVTFSLAILGAIYSYQFMKIFSSEEFIKSGGLELASQLFKILAFYLPITMLNAVAMAVLGVMGLTFRAMNGSIFLNVGIIIAAVAYPFYKYIPMEPVIGIAIGALVGAFLQLLYQFYPLFKLKIMTFPNFSVFTWWRYKPLHEVVVLMIPRALGQGALILALMINTFFAIQVGEGVLTYIVTAVIIIQVPIGLFGVATGFAAHPILTKTIVDRQYKKFSKLLVESLDTAMWLAIVTSSCFAFLIVPFYAVLFQHGSVTYYDTLQNSIAVCAYSIGIVFSAGSKVLLNAFYAINSTKQIVYNALIYLIINFVLTSYLAPKYGIIGLGVSYGTATAADFLLNCYFLKRNFLKSYSSKSPFFEGGVFFGFKIFIFCISSYLISYLGIFLVNYFWKRHYRFIPFELNFLNQLLILSVGGLLFCVAAFFIINTFGPLHLKSLTQGLLKKLK